tara:strand:- start:354 stop:578 length:225 start_codon:yes stop_codon:yes gene_type:complete
MGRMKEVWQMMRDESFQGSLEEYLEANPELIIKQTKLMCPECMKAFLVKEKAEEAICTNCNTTFEHKNGTLRYK